MPPAAPRSLAAYQGTVFPHHGLDEGERACSGEGLPGERWAPYFVACRSQPSPDCGLVRGRNGAIVARLRSHCEGATYV